MLLISKRHNTVMENILEEEVERGRERYRRVDSMKKMDGFNLAGCSLRNQEKKNLSWRDGTR